MNIHSIILEVSHADDLAMAEHFYQDAFGLDDRVRIGLAESPTSGFRGFAPSLIMAQPADVDELFGRALDAGGEVLKPVVKSVWGYGGSLRAPDGTVWQIASSGKKNKGLATGQIEKLVLLLGVEDVKASKRFYEDQGLRVARSYGGKYAEFDSGTTTLALYKRASLSKQIGVIDPVGTGSHRVKISADGAFVDPDGFAWEAAG